MLRDLAYDLYSRKLRRELSGAALPEHVGLIMDGNRRWARQMGLTSPSLGHKYGAEHVEDVLNWCERAGIKHVTVFVCSAENLQRRGDAEIAFLMQVIEDVVADRLAIMDGNRRWARQMGLTSPRLGHKCGAEHVEDVLNWCERAGIKHVTVFVCSAEDRQRRGAHEH